MSGVRFQVDWRAPILWRPGGKGLPPSSVGPGLRRMQASPSRIPNTEHRTPSPSARGGSALIVVLWVILLMSVMIGSLAFDAHIEARITSYYRRRTKADVLARSGMEVASMLMAQASEIKGAKVETAESDKDRWYDNAERLSQGLAIRGLTETLGEGTIELEIVPEPGRRNVNVLTEEDWERVLEVGGIPEEMWDELIDSALDWIDKDDIARAEGAETENYYSTLERPYKAKDGPLDTVDELLLVKGFERIVLYGGTIRTSDDETEEPIRISGISDLLTTYGDGKVNVNAASRRVLMTLPDVDGLVADVIIEEREGLISDTGVRENTSFKDVNTFMNRIPDLDPSVKDRVTTDSAIYRITSSGIVHGVRRQIWCVVEYSNKSLTVLRWREQD